ncbi:MAG: hypothetical protein D6693_01745 [Planctomycetota bacterium]|nr:MAG: hypothetical protein D6693_01745 [Planctomycetota bacterium]
MTLTGLHERMIEAAEGRTYRALGDLTDFNSETVRRYMQGQAPSVEFVAAFCEGLGLNVDWLLTGRGPMRRDEVRAQALKESNPSELLSAVAGGLEEVSDRLERVERFVQSLEARVRAELCALEEKGRARRREPNGRSIDGHDARTADPRNRAKSIAGAIPGGSDPDAD